MFPTIGLMLAICLVVKAVELVVMGLSARIIEQDGDGIYSRPNYAAYFLSVVGAFVAGASGLLFLFYWLTVNRAFSNM